MRFLPVRPSSVFLLLLVTASVAAPTACGDGTGRDRNPVRPVPPPPPPPPPAPPPIDEVVPCCSVTSEGLQVSVTRIEHNWVVPDSVAPPDSVFQPGPGMEFVTVELRLENVAGTGARSYNTAQFQLTTGNGSTVFVEPVRRLPALRFGSVLANLPQEGWITFEIPRGSELRHLVWTPAPNVTYRIQLNGAPGG